MPDLLVPLYGLPVNVISDVSYSVGKPIGPELLGLEKWLIDAFGTGWLGEWRVAFQNSPRTVLVAKRDARPIGFACYDATALGMFGPFGVAEAERGRGIGARLLHATLIDMRTLGYAYAIIGDARNVSYYERTVGARAIEGSSPGLYADFHRNG